SGCASGGDDAGRPCAQPKTIDEIIRPSRRARMPRAYRAGPRRSCPSCNDARGRSRRVEGRGACSMSYQSAKTKKRSGSAPGGRVRDPTGPSARGRPAARGRTPPFGPSARLYSSSEVGEAEDVERSEIDVSMHLVRRAAFSRLFDAPVAPVKLGSFTVLDRLGSGAMGTVYSAYDGQLDRKVAIKLLHRDETDRDRMLQDAQALARLSHPNVVAI